MQLCDENFRWTNIYSTKMEFTWNQQPGKFYALGVNYEGVVCEAVTQENYALPPVSLVSSFGNSILGQYNYTITIKTEYEVTSLTSLRI